MRCYWKRPAPDDLSYNGCKIKASGEGAGRSPADSASEPAPALEFLTIRELAARVAAAGPRRYLLRGLWPAGDYGIHAAEAKAQKTWNTVDVAVAVASGEPWLNHVPVDDPGPVLMLCGEGGEANILRRLRATAEERCGDVEDLPLVVLPRAPRLTSEAHIGAIADQLAATSPRLVTLDPLYLSAAGVSLSNLYEVGEVLGRVQDLCSESGASLWVTTHFNRKGGRGLDRILGAGPAEWGRVLVSATVLSRHKNAATQETDVLSELSVVGGEVPDTALRVRRRIWADDPADLDSPLHVRVEAEDTEVVSEEADGLPPAAVKLLAALEAVGPATSDALVDWIKEHHGHGLRRETVSRTLNDLQRRGMARSDEEGPFSAKTWEAAEGGSV